MWLGIKGLAVDVRGLLAGLERDWGRKRCRVVLDRAGGAGFLVAIGQCIRVGVGLGFGIGWGKAVRRAGGLLTGAGGCGDGRVAVGFGGVGVVAALRLIGGDGGLASNLRLLSSLVQPVVASTWVEPARKEVGYDA